MRTRKGLIAALCAVVLLPLLSSSVAAQPPVNTKAKWQDRGELSLSRTGHTMAFGRKMVQDPRKPQAQIQRTILFIFGGVSSSSGCTDLTEFYDGREKKWKLAAKMPSPRCGAVAVTAKSGLIYLIGGKHRNQALATVDVYDPEADRWLPSAAPALQKPLAQFGAVDTPDGSIYLFGGHADSSQDLRKAVYRLAPGGSSWQRLPDMPVSRAPATAAFAAGHIFVFGERAPGVNVYDPVQGEWKYIQGAPVGLEQAAVVRGKIYLLQTVSVDSAKLWRYTPSGSPLAKPGRWKEIPGPTSGLLTSMSTGGLGGANGSLHVAGGYSKWNGHSARVLRYLLPPRK